MITSILINYYKYNKCFQKSLIYRSSSSSVTTIKRKPIKALKAILTVSPSALSRINTMFSLLKAPLPIGIRISITKRGCNGFTYTMKYVANNEEGLKSILKDDIIPIADKIAIYIEPSAVFTIVGTVMEWKDNDISSEFSFINPNAKGVCGCGESFNV